MPNCNKELGEVPVRRFGEDLNLIDNCCHTCEKIDANKVLSDGKLVVCEPDKWPNRTSHQCQTKEVVY